MNNKELHIKHIEDIVVDCCSMNMDSLGTKSFTSLDLVGPSREENIVMSRCILVLLILREGFSVTTCAKILNRTCHAITNLHKKGQDYLITSRAFNIAYRDAASKVDKLLDLD